MLKFIRDHELAVLLLLTVALMAAVAAYVGDRIHVGRPKGWIETPVVTDEKLDAKLDVLNARHAENLGPNEPEVECTDLR